MKDNNYTGFEIAVVGMSCRFPGASNVDEFWENLKGGVDSISRFSDDELRQYGISEEDLSDPNYVKAKGIIENANFFDASFFGLTPTEANTLDPQIRIFLQCAYHALEDAGYHFGKEKNNVGVFVGATPSIYWQADHLRKTGHQFSERFSSMLLTDKDFINSRVSYLMNLHGPSSSIYTACSTSLVTIDTALQSLLTGKCDIALAGGVSLSLPYKSGYTYNSAMMMSKEGSIFPFDSEATGTVWGDGAGVVILKRLEDALKEGDNIHAVIKGIATNNDGNRKVGFTAYSAKGQVEVIRNAHSMAEVTPGSISYIEGHGSATPLGDKIEIGALMEVFQGAGEDYSCALGSVKANLSNLNVASGMAGLIKVCLMLKHAQIPPSVNFKSPNSKLAESGNLFRVHEKLTPWENTEFPLRAGISSFGIGGTNVHMVVEKAPFNQKTFFDDRNQLICLSAKTPSGLNRLSHNLSDFIAKNESELDIDSLAFTLQTGREHFQHRRFLVAEELEKLTQDLAKEYESDMIRDSFPIIAVFSGIKNLHLNFAKDLYSHEVYFRDALDNCFRILNEFTGRDFKSIIYGENESVLLQDSQILQGLDFSFQYALGTLLNSLEIKPDYMVGYGIGEYVAACFAGVFSLKDALEILIERDRLLNSSVADLEVALPVLSDEIGAPLKGNEAGLSFDLSSKMEQVSEQFKEILSRYDLKKANTPMVSGHTGTWCEEFVYQPEYWVKHLSETIRPAESLDTLTASSPNAVFLNIGTGDHLSLYEQQLNDSKDHLKFIEVLKNESSALITHTFFLRAIGMLWSYGGIVDWNAYHYSNPKQKASLPTYPFEESSFSLQISKSKENPFNTTNFLRNDELSSWFYIPSWKRIPQIISTDNLKQKTQNLLIFGGEEFEAVQNFLDPYFDTVIVVSYAEHFERINANQYELNYDDKDDLLKLFWHLRTEKIGIDAIFDLTDFHVEVAVDDKKLIRTVNLVQAVYETGFDQTQIEYVAVCSQMFSIFGEERTDLFGGGILSAIHSIPKEYPNINCRLIEVDDKAYGTNTQLFFKQIIKEFKAGSKDKIVAYRGLNRWAQTVESYPILLQDSGESRIKDWGTYLVIDGAGEAGFTIAEGLLKSNRLNIILVGFSDIPEQEEWADWLENYGPEHAISKKITKISKLRKEEGNLLIIHADITSKTQMSAVFEKVKLDFEQINGVFYVNDQITKRDQTTKCELVSKRDQGLISDKTQNQLNDEILLKTEELFHLQQLVKNELVEFVIVVSSFTTVLGGPGMVSEMAIKHFIDSLVLDENKRMDNPAKWMTLNLSYDTVEKVSFQENSLLTSSALKSGILNSFITGDEGDEVFKRILLVNNEESHIMISPVDLPSLIEESVNPYHEDIAEELQLTVKNTRPVLATPYVAPGSDLEQKLVEIWEEILGYTPIGIRDDFFQLGGDSLSMIRLISRIHKFLRVQICLQDAFENKNISMQAALILAAPKVSFVHIKSAPVKVYYPQSSIQRRIFILDQMNPGMTAYNVPIVFKVIGELNIELCENVFKEIINRHETLRTSFHLLNEEPVQRIHKHVNFKVEYIQNETESLDQLINGFIRGFDLSTPALIRVGLKTEEEGMAHMIIDMHHIVTDGVSYVNIIQEFMALCNNQKLEPLKVQYKDYVEWQQNGERESQLKEQEAFWLNQFESIPDIPNIPTDFSRPQLNSFQGATVTFDFNAQESEELRKVCEKQEVTMYTLLLSALNVLVSKLSGQEDITIGTSTAGRQHMDIERLIGVFINTLALRNAPKGEQSFVEFLNQVKDNVLQCFANQDYSYEQLIGELDLKQDLSHNPLFDIMFEYYNFNLSEFESEDMHLSHVEHANTSSKLDLSFRVLEKENNYVFHLDYRTDLFKKETIERFVAYYKNILKAVVQNIEVGLCDIDILTVKEKELLMNQYNDTALPYLRDTNLIALFEHEVKLHPDRIAVSDGKKELTYKELNEQANKVANYLIAERIVPGNIVGLLFERSLNMIVSILGVLKAGGGYLPIDPSLPEQRISYMLNHSRAAFLLSQNEFLEMHTAYLPTQAIDSSKIELQSVANSGIEIQPADLAYCIFTSGSSGNPKGVMMNHRSVINLVKGLEEKVYRAYEDKILKVALLASFSFDASVQQIYGSLLQGHSLYIADDESRRDGAKLRSFYERNNIDISDGTPTHLRLLLDALGENTSVGNFSSWILAGETLPKEFVKEFYSKVGDKVQLYNFYGPTETCVDSTSYKVDRDCLEDYPFIPIGKPLPNERIYITDTHGGLVPTGVIGELCIAGDGLAKGYVGDQTTSSEKFRSGWVIGEERVYRTGDMARWLPDGNLEYRGRIDNQVKLRGYRIELSEIEHHLSTHAEINHCVVEFKAYEHEKCLVAYYESAAELQVSDLRYHLAQRLPDYMIPSYYMQMDQLPFTANGKIDRNALPDYELKVAGNYTPPTTETEEKLVKIWADVLKRDVATIGINNNFFDLGGQSLKLVFLANRIRETFKLSISLIKLTSLKDIQELAKEINSGIEGDYFKIQKAGEMDFYPLSSAQKQFYFLNQLNKNSTVYNQPQAFTINGLLEREKIRDIFHQIIERHEIFRTRIQLVNDLPVQYVLEEATFELEYFNSSLEKSAEIIKEFIRPFDLHTAPLLRAGLIRIDEERHILITDRHHIVSDGVSLGIFLRDFISLYQGKELSPIELQYRDYAAWQESEIYQKNLASQKHFWNGVFATPPSILALQTDYERPVIPTYHGAQIDFVFELAQTKILNNLAKSLGVTLFSVVLGIFKILLYKVTGQKDLIIGTPVSGRRDTEIEDIMGVFINMLALRNDVEDHGNLYDFLKQVHQSVILGLEHQDYPYEKLINDLGIARDFNRNSLFDVMFVYKNEEPLELKLQDLELKTYVLDSNTSQMDLILHVNATENEIQLGFQYATDLFQRSTVENFVKYFKQITDQVILNIPIAAISLLGVDEINQLRRFNTSEISFEIKENIVESFEKQVLMFPDRYAVVYNGLNLSYKELNEQSNKLAAYLVNQGVVKGDIVGLLLDRSSDIIIGILGILKSGAAYLPIDFKLPFERINYMLESCNSKLLLGHKEHLDRFKEVIAIHDINDSSIKVQENYNLSIQRNSSDLAYCIFTSGSTGAPKGVLMEDGSVVNLAEGLSATVYKGLDSGLSVGLIAAYSFDASCQQIFGALLNGHSLYICQENERMDGNELYNFYKKHRINVSDGTPTHFSMFLRSLKGKIELPDFRVWLLAGEALPKELVQEFYTCSLTENMTLYNLYGPTETCVDSTYYRIDPADLDKFKAIPIGRPLPNERIYIVDELGNSVPQGVIGELCIAGAGLARGYVGNGIENRKFIANWIEGEERVYRSGDLAYWLPDGNIAYKGRIDNQIKLRGYRIEPGEIEYALSSHEAVLEGVVSLKNIEGESYLSAYYLAEQKLDGELLREYLSRILPEYMVPSFYVQLEKMPLTTNGKLDKDALPIPDRVNKELYVGASSKTEREVIGIWAEVLKIDPSAISITQSFLQLGGNSLMAIQIANKIKREFNIEIKLVEIFQKNTVVQQANFIDASVWINEADPLPKMGNREINI
ncbi:amino acid adenylation domain-containing protein [Pedobacter sp. UYP1]|uniref:type I polyketide synthase n=1 Tax=Pedobacter sp. UYP1 TaxID=1756396 RepID=UPI003399EF66